MHETAFLICALSLMQAVDWAAKFPGAHPRALDLMARMLQFNPGNRMTVEQALAHPYMAQVCPHLHLLSSMRGHRSRRRWCCLTSRASTLRLS